MNKNEITAEQVEQWKKQHGKVFVASADGHKAYYRKPTRKDLSYAMTLQNQPLEMTETLLKNCFLGGDPIMHEDTEYLLGCSGDLVESMIHIKKVEVGEV